MISERRPCGAALSLAERIEIHFAEPRPDHRVLKLACRRIAGAGKCQSARVFERERAKDITVIRSITLVARARRRLGGDNAIRVESDLPIYSTISSADIVTIWSFL